MYVSQTRHKPECPDPQVIFFEIQLSARIGAASAFPEVPFPFKRRDKQRNVMWIIYVISSFTQTQYTNRHAARPLFCFVSSLFSHGLIFMPTSSFRAFSFPPWFLPHTSLAHRSFASCNKQVAWLVLLYILRFNKENTNVSQCERSWWYQCHAFHWFLFTWCPREAPWLVAFHTWPGNFVHLTGSRRVLWRSEKRQRDKN